MTILLLGATGRTGQELLDQALRAGITVHVLVRDRTKIKFPSKSLKVFESQQLDEVALRTAMSRCDAVLSTLNLSRRSDFPWSSLRTPRDFLTSTIRNVIRVAGELGVRRLIVTTAWGVNETRRDLPGWFRWLIDNSNIGPAYKDHEVQEHLIKASSCDWSIVRPVGLTNARKDRRILVTSNHQPRPSLTISRYNVARFMLELYTENRHLGEAITISEA